MFVNKRYKRLFTFPHPPLKYQLSLFTKAAFITQCIIPPVNVELISSEPTLSTLITTTRLVHRAFTFCHVVILEAFHDVEETS